MAELFRFSDTNFSSLIWEISETVEQLLERIPLSAEESNYFAQLKSEQRKRQWLAYRAALMALNGDRHTPIHYQESGKPYRVDESLQISVSHSGNYAQAICSDVTPVGVDLEVRSSKAHKVRRKFMSPAEMAFADTVDFELVALLTWCAKEAMYKAMGAEGVIFAEDMQVADFDFEKLTAKGTFRFENLSADFQIRFFLHPEFASAMCHRLLG